MNGRDRESYLEIKNCPNRDDFCNMNEIKKN